MSESDKPDGSFLLPNDRGSIMSFCSELKLRKIPFLGKVTERLLTDGLGITHVGGLLAARVQIHHCFSSRMYEFLVRAALGVQAAGEDGPDVRKSVSRERTFLPLKEGQKLREIVKNLCNMVCEDFRGLEGLDGGKCVTVKVKTSDFRVRSRSKTVNDSVGHDAASIEAVAMPLLEEELPFEGRLLGVRVSELVGPRIDAIAADKRKALDPSQARIEKFFVQGPGKRKRPRKEAESNAIGASVMSNSDAGFGMDKGFGKDSESIDGDGILLNSYYSDDGSFELSIPPCPASQSQPLAPGNLPPGLEPPAASCGADSEVKQEEYACPVCGCASYTDLSALNRHLDLCLNAQAGFVPASAAVSPAKACGKKKRRKLQMAMDSFVCKKEN